MKIVYRPDGSIKKLELSNYVNQNNNNVDEICVAIEGKEPESYISTAYFTLPNGDTNFLSVSTLKDFSVGDDPTIYHGKSFFLTNAQTLYAGELSMSIEFVDAEDTNKILFTYNYKFSINPSNVLPSEVNITHAEYNGLVTSISEKITSSTARLEALDSGITSEKVYTYDQALILLNQKSTVSVSDQSASSVPVISYITIDGEKYQILPASEQSTIEWGAIRGSISDQLDLDEILTKCVRRSYVDVGLTATKIKSDISNVLINAIVKDKNGNDITSNVSNGDYDSSILNGDIGSGSKKITYTTTELFVAVTSGTNEYTLYPMMEYFQSGDLVYGCEKKMEPGTGYIPISPGGTYDLINIRVFNQGIQYTLVTPVTLPPQYTESPIYSFTLTSTVTYKKHTFYRNTMVMIFGECMLKN